MKKPIVFYSIFITLLILSMVIDIGEGAQNKLTVVYITEAGNERESTWIVDARTSSPYVYGSRGSYKLVISEPAMPFGLGRSQGILKHGVVEVVSYRIEGMK